MVQPPPLSLSSSSSVHPHLLLLLVPSSRPGALLFLGGLGFTEQEEDGEPYLVLGEDAASILQATSDESLA